jgi:hypothetical protein
MVSVIRFHEVYAYFLWSKSHVPSGAALCWRRSPTETSDRAVRERDRLLVGSTHAVPEHAGCRGWQSAPRRIANSALQMMHLKPNACTRTGRPDARMGIGCGICALKLNRDTESVANEKSAVSTNMFKILTKKRSIDHVCHIPLIQARYSHPAAFVEICNGTMKLNLNSNSVNKN